MHPHAPVRSVELPPLFQRGGEATRRATLGRVGEAARDPSGGGRGCSSPCATREVGSLRRWRVRVSGQHATQADWGREKERGSATAVGGKGQGNSVRPWRQRVRRPFPLAPNQAPTSACASAPATSTCARGMGVAHMRVASVAGGAGQTGGGGGGEGDSGDGALCVLPHPPSSRLRKKNSP